MRFPDRGNRLTSKGGAVVLLFVLLGFLGWRVGPVSGLYLAPERPEAAPDLVITQMVVSPPNPGPGQTATIVVTIENKGDATAPGFFVYLFVESPDDPPTTSTPPTAQIFFGIGLLAGRSVIWTRTGQEFTQQNPRVVAWVDPTNLVAESDETNNLFPPPPQGAPDAFEDDDGCAQAKVILTDGIAQTRNLYRQGGVADVDWVRFEATGGVEYEIKAKDLGADADLSLELYGNCTQPLAFGGGAEISFTAPTDATIYVKAGSVTTSYGGDNAYELSVTANNSCSTSLEPNDICLLPADLAVGAGAQGHSFCSEADVDWLRFAVKAGAKYKVLATNLGSHADVQMGLYTSCDAASAATGEQLEFQAPSSGYVYLKTNNSSPQVFGPGTDYEVTVSLDGPDGCTEDALEPDNIQSAAQPVRIDNRPQTRNSCPAGDQDWMRFDAQEGKTYTVETLALAGQSDTTLCRFDANGVQLECDHDGGAGLGSRLTYHNATAGTYYFAIKQADHAIAGAAAGYAIQVLNGECKADAFEEDDKRTAARPIPADGSGQERNICPKDDDDWVSFSVVAGGDYLIEASPLGPEADTVIELYDSAGNLIARNDDYSPGIGSRLTLAAASAGTYFVRAQNFNPERYGAGTDYVLSVRPDAPPTTPTPTPTPPPPPPQPQDDSEPTAVRTLILVNRTRLAALHGQAATDPLMAKLEQLAQNDQVRGEIIRLDNNAEVSAAYAAWTANLTDVERTNQVTSAIRRVINTYVTERQGIEYLVLVGDDRALPFRRLIDATPSLPEKTYTDVDATHPTGAAIRGNYYMTDDFFADRLPTPHKGRELYIPDLGVGRLIETPADMVRTIDLFLTSPTSQIERVLVTGYDFLYDTGQEECEAWRQAMGGQDRTSCLVGHSWTEQEFSNLQLRTDQPFKMQSINGHAAHYAQGMAAGGVLSANEISQSALDLAGGLIYTLGCHGGLNVPPNNTVSPLDLPEVFVRKGASYIGNTGYGWGSLDSIGLSEKVIRLFNKEMTKPAPPPLGKALARAKSLYFEQDADFSTYDEKVMQELILYGLPMQRIAIGSSASDAPVAAAAEDDFPGVDFELPAPTGEFGEGEVVTTTLRIDFSRVLDPNDAYPDLEPISTGSGDYLTLNGFINADAGEPVQPLHFGNLAFSNFPPPRAAVIRRGVFETRTVDDILVGTAVNEYVPRSAADEAVLEAAPGWHPEVQSVVRTHDGVANLVTQLGQYDPTAGGQRLYSLLELDVYYSASPDQTPPEIIVVDGLYTPATGRVAVKVGATDAAGIQDVVVSYIRDRTQASTEVESVKLSLNVAAQKWIGSFPGDHRSTFYVQVVDKNGNLTTANNKGAYFEAVRSRNPLACGLLDCLFLPAVSAQH